MASFDPAKLKKRVLTALAIGPLSLFLIYYGGWPFLVLMAAVFIISQCEWFCLARRTSRFSLYYPLGFLYLTFCFLCFLSIGIEKSIDGVVLVALVIASDIGAYFTGKMIGGPKMAPLISPNKTWAGLGGAMFSPAILLVLAENFLLRDQVSDFYPVVLFFAFGALIGLFGQMGDILISLMKRIAGVKDTGDILPGHGGVLDRIDALLLACPVFLLLEYLLGNV